MLSQPLQLITRPFEERLGGIERLEPATRVGIEGDYEVTTPLPIGRRAARSLDIRHGPGPSDGAFLPVMSDRSERARLTDAPAR